MCLFSCRGKDNQENSPYSGDKQLPMTQGGRGAAREGSPDIPQQQQRTLPTATREWDRSSSASMPRALPKGTPPSTHQARSPHCITGRAWTLLPLPRQSLRACTAPGAAHPPQQRGELSHGQHAHPCKPGTHSWAQQHCSQQLLRTSIFPGTLSRRQPEGTGWPDRDQQASGWEPEHGVGLAHGVSKAERQPSHFRPPGNLSMDRFHV